MKTFNSLLRYNLNVYLKSNKFIMPLIAWIAIMFIMYSIKPLDVISSFMVSAVFLFFIMIWITFSYFESLDIISEQLIILKVRRESLYYMGNNIFVMLIGIIMSIIGVAFPFIINVVNHFSLFNRTITLWDAFSSLILHIILAILGCSIGILFQPRCMKSRKLSIEVILLIAIISLIKFQIVQKVPAIKYVAWVIPPVCDIQGFFSGKNFFYLIDIVKSVIYALIYTVIYNIINVGILKKKLF